MFVILLELVSLRGDGIKNRSRKDLERLYTIFVGVQLYDRRF